MLEHDFILSYTDAEDYGFAVRAEEEVLNSDTAALLDRICSDVEAILSDFSDDVASWDAMYGDDFPVQ